MALCLRYLFACVLLGLPGMAQSEQEVHVVAVMHGQQTDSFYALPVVRVLVDRSDQDVSLVLLDGGQVHWHVETTVGTRISNILRSGRPSQDSLVSLSGIPMVGVDRLELPLVFQPFGREFRTLLDKVTDSLATERIHSFQGTYQAGVVAVMVDRVHQSTDGLARDYLAHRVSNPKDLPGEISNWVTYDKESDAHSVAFTQSGVSLTSSTGTRHFPITADVPGILLPSAGVYDPVSQMIYAISYGGEGYIYSVDVRSGRWEVVTSLDGYDPADLLYDSENRQLILTGAFSRPGDIRMFGLDGSRSATFIPTTAFPGLVDLFDYGNEHGPPLIPKAYKDGWLLLKAFANPASSHRDVGPYRLYAVRVATKEVHLLRYGND